MDVSLSSLFIRYLSTPIVSNRDRSVLYTAMLFLCDDEQYSDLIPAHMNINLVNVPTVEAILKVASPIEIALVLWSPLGWALPDDIFMTWFRSVTNATTDFRALHLIAGAAYDRLRAHPQAVAVPDNVVTSLVESPFSEARIIGAKLMGLLSCDSARLAEVVLRLVQSDIENERVAGTFILQDIVNELLSGSRQIDSVVPLLNIRPSIVELIAKGGSRQVQDNAQAALSFLNDLERPVQK
jgi:hypothetical protein